MNCPNSPRWWAPCVGALILSTACVQSRSPYCEESVTVLESLDTPSPAGPTAAEIFAVVEGQRMTELEYVPDESDAVFVDIEPGGEGSTSLVLELTREAAGELRFVDAEVVYPPGPTNEIAVDCPDRIEIDAKLGFSSGDGVFAELFDVVVAADVEQPGGESGGELGVARIRREFDPAGLMGALEVLSIDPPNPDAVDYALEVHYPLTETAAGEDGEIGQPRGYVGGGAQYSSGKGKDATVTYGVFHIATFGAWDIY